jgi:gliding motility-associated-like protein
VSASETPVVNAAKKASDKAAQVPAADKKAVGKIDQEPKSTVLKATGTDAVKPENNDGKVALVVTPVPVKQENAAVKVPCGKQLKVSVTKEPNGNAWVFNLNGVQPGAYVQWNFGDGQIASGNMLKHEYPDANDEYSVKAIAWLPPACMDTGISIPDVFTPNGDGINDNLVITVPATAYYNLIVSDKKGKQVFVSNNPETRWNGRCGSQDCESGMYRVTLVYKVPEALQAKSISKMVMLQRGQP